MSVGLTNLLDQEEGNVLLTLAAAGLLSNEAQFPAACLGGHLETPKTVETGTLNNIAILGHNYMSIASIICVQIFKRCKLEVK